MLKKMPFMEDKYDQLALSLCVAAAAVFFVLVGIKYFNFGYYDWDLAFFTQASWNLIHGSAQVSLAGLNFFGDHSYYFIVFLLPVFALISHPLTLVAFKILAHALAGFLLYRYAKKNLEENCALFVLAAYLMCPPNVFAILYEFNIESLSPPLLILAFIYYQKSDIKRFWLAAALLLLIKENMALVIAFFGLHRLIFKKNEKLALGVVPLITGAMTFLLLIKWLIPLALSGESHAFIKRYAHMGSSLLDIFFYLVGKPLGVFRMVFEHRNILFMFNLGGAWLSLAVVSPGALFLAAPLLLQHLLSNVWAEHTIFYHYASSIVPFIFLASIHTLMKLKQKQSLFVARVVALLLFLTTVIQLFSFAKEVMIRINPHAQSSARLKWDFVREIPSNAAVVSTFDFLAPLSLRKNLYSFHVYYDPMFHDKKDCLRYTACREGLKMFPQNADHMLIDFDDLWLQDRIKKDRGPISGFLQETIMQSQWKVKEAAGNIILLEKNIEEGSRLIESSQVPFSTVYHAKPTDEGSPIILMNTTIKKQETKFPSLPVALEWYCRENPSKDLWMEMSLFKDGVLIAVEKRQIGYILYPTSLWKSGEYIKEFYGMPLRKDFSGPGDYQINVKILEN